MCVFVRWELSGKQTYRERECFNRRVCVGTCMHICASHTFFFFEKRESLYMVGVLCVAACIYVGVCMCVDVLMRRARQCGCFPKVSAPFRIRSDKSNPAGNRCTKHTKASTTYLIFSRHSIHAQTRSNLAGTPRYMAPEAYRDEKCTEKIDIYSLAMMMWEMLTSQLPWDGSNFQVFFFFVGAYVYVFIYIYIYTSVFCVLCV